MKTLIPIIALLSTIQVKALVCETDIDCFNGAYALIKKSIKNNVCKRQANDLLNKLENPLQASNAISTLEVCLYRAKDAIKAKRTADNRKARISDLKRSL